MSAYAADYDSRIGAPSSSQTAMDLDPTPTSAHSATASATFSCFPLEDAVTHFRDSMQQRVNRLALLSVQDQQARRVAKLNAAIAESKAQETVLAGAHTGVTISTLAKLATKPQFAALHQTVRQLKQAQKAPRTSRDQAVSATAKPRAAQFSEHHSSSHLNNAASKSSPEAPPTNRHRGAKRAAEIPVTDLKMTTQNHQQRSVSSRQHAGHAANTASAPSQSKNARGGDRSTGTRQLNHRSQQQQQQQQQQQASSTNSQRARNPDTGRNSNEPHRHSKQQRL